MRTFDEILTNIKEATTIYDVAQLDALAQEMMALGTREASAAAASTRALISAFGGDNASAVAYSRSAFAVYEELCDRANMARVTGNMGHIHLNTGDYRSAWECYQRAIDVYEELGDRDGVATYTDSLGLVCRSTGDYPSAMEHFRRALAIHTELGDHAAVANVTSHIALVYSSIGDHAQALEYTRAALQMFDALNARAIVEVLTGNLGTLFHQIGDFPSAFEHYRIAQAAHEESGDTHHAQQVTGNLITGMLDNGLLDDAIDLLNRQDVAQLVHPDSRAHYLDNRARVAEFQADLDGARGHLKQALDIVFEIGDRSSVADYHRKLRDLARRRNDFDDYVLHNDEYLRITEEIRGQEAARKLAMLEAEKRIAAERAEKEKHKALLYNTLPPAIAERVLRGETVNDSHDMAAVMFMDMVGFTTMSSTMEAGEVVKLLSEIFTTCDAIMAKHGMMKIKTIGDSYMAVAIESNTEDQKPKTTQTVNSAVSNAARAAVQVLSTLSEQHPQIKVRIGLHCGPVTAGVIGTERLQYDVWGDTVNVASRMESHGEPGRIHVSESFALALDPRLRGDDEVTGWNDEELDPGLRLGDDTSLTAHRPPLTDHDSLTSDSLTLLKRGLTDVKGKGPMTTYWLESSAT